MVIDEPTLISLDQRKIIFKKEKKNLCISIFRSNCLTWTLSSKVPTPPTSLLLGSPSTLLLPPPPPPPPESTANRLYGKASVFSFFDLPQD